MVESHLTNIPHTGGLEKTWSRIQYCWKIENIDDLESVIRLVEEKLKETKKLVILLLESSSQNLEICYVLGICKHLCLDHIVCQWHVRGNSCS